MPTIALDPSPEPEPLSGSEPQTHRQRRIAESFGSDADRYDRNRPRYPGALVERIAAACPGPDVLDVGCGTGIAARQFQAIGCRVLGVDVDARMAEVARRTGVEAEVAAFETWDPAGREFDAVVAGQTWHWVDPVAGAAKAAKVLRPGGRLALFWNVFKLPPGLDEAFAAIYRQALPDMPALNTAAPGLDMYSPILTAASDGIRRTDGFGEPEQWRFDWSRPYTRDEWLEQVPTFGGYSRLTPEKQQDISAGIGAAVDAVGGRFTMRYDTVALTATRTGRPKGPE